MIRMICVCVLLAGLVQAEKKEVVEPAASSEWTVLYDGHGFDQWQETTGNWVEIDDGVLELQPRKGERGWTRYSSYLVTKKTYKDFVLHVEYAYPPKGNSGIYFRIGDMKDATKYGLEAQILDSSGKGADAKMSHHDHGGIIQTAGASKNMSKKPGEWNTMVITAKGKQIQIELNGEPIVDVNLTGKKTDDRPLKGWIALQDHGTPNNVKFRNIKIKEL